MNPECCRNILRRSSFADPQSPILSRRPVSQVIITTLKHHVFCTDPALTKSNITTQKYKVLRTDPLPVTNQPPKLNTTTLKRRNVTPRVFNYSTLNTQLPNLPNLPAQFFTSAPQFIPRMSTINLATLQKLGYEFSALMSVRESIASTELKEKHDEVLEKILVCNTKSKVDNRELIN
jgi:hypothetical protein